MKRFTTLFLLVCCIAGSAVAEDIFILRAKSNSSAGADIWARNATLSAEALSLYFPTTFTVKGKTVTYTRNAAISFSSQDKGVVATMANGDMLHFVVDFSSKPVLPKASTTITITIKISELKAGDIFSESPGFLALEKAILQSKLATGSAWVSSITFNKKNAFTVKVALKS